MSVFINPPFSSGELSDASYINVVKRVMEEGLEAGDRTGTGTLGSCFIQSDYLLTGGSIPLISSKSVNLKPLLVELEWYLKGTGNIAFLKGHGVKIWDAWADDKGDLGPVYGKQWRRWEDTRVVRHSSVDSYLSKGYAVLAEIGDKRVVVTREIDQLQRIVDQLRTNPDSRRIMLSAWNVGELEDMALPPCHFAFSLWSRDLTFATRLAMAAKIGETHTKHKVGSVYSRLVAEIEEGIPVDEVTLDALEIPRRVLCSAMIQRSVDVFVGMPFNIAGYGILTHFIAQITGHMPGTFSHFGCDVHLYSNHKDGVDELIARERPAESDPVVMLPASWRELSDFRWDEILVAGYAPKPWIKVPVAV